MQKIPLTQDKIALVDTEDFERINPHKWCAFKHGNSWYAIRRVGGTMIYMHREILGLAVNSGSITDHVNGNGLDNRKSNLRLCSVKENVRNQHTTSGFSQYKGVSWHKQRNRWRATIMVNRKQKHLGLFGREDIAALAYDMAAVREFGEFACLNFN